MMSNQVLVDRLLNEEYTVGEPWKLPKGTGFVLPILGAPPFPQRSYVLLQEVKDKVTFTDSGGISRVDVTNRSGSSVYIRKGTVLKAGTQPRSPLSGYVLEPIPKTVPLAVNCIHASRGIRAGGIFDVRGLTPHSIYMSLGDQSRTWASASNWSRRTRAGGSGSSVRYAQSGPMSLSASLGALSDDNIADALDRIEEVKGTVEDVLASIPGDHVNQVGIAVFDLRGVVAVETFDHPDSWRAFSDSITRSYAETLTEESDLYEVKTDKAASVLISFLRKAAGAAKTLVTTNSVSNIFSLIGDKLSGEIVEIQGKEIHMTLARDERPQRPAGGILRTRQRSRYEPIARTYLTTSIDQTTGPDDEHISTWLRKKGSEDLLSYIDEKGPRRFHEILKSSKLNVSRSTLSIRLREAQNMNLIGHLSRGNGKPAYGLTDDGHTLMERIKQTKE